MPDSSPPSYSTMALAHPYPQPLQPTFRHRKSATIIPITSSTSAVFDTSITPTTSPDLLPNLPLPSADMPQRSERSSVLAFHTVDARNISTHVRHDSLERRDSRNSSAAEEGEATPLLAEQNGEHVKGKWYQGPLVGTAIKFSVLFVIFTAVVAGTFWFGTPKLEPSVPYWFILKSVLILSSEDGKVIKLPRSFADLQALK